ncbi:hypothetical protein [uncultured Tateyamaria sp.]|uniref:hypothetical protein n=1 Tax=uncultured Tateyamaria sp. TaxID=455651 RepID=UPI00260EC933|nr:hypothetical protein [uncultured Tateyamaria sp.]
MPMMRACLSILLSLMLLVTSHSMAVARGADRAVDRIVICTGTTVSAIYVDADGQPTQAPHLCPDCALHSTDALTPSAISLTAPTRFHVLQVWEPVAFAEHRASGRPGARAPPLVI